MAEFDMQGPPWLGELLSAMGWDGGTIHQAIAAVREMRADIERLRRIAAFFIESDPWDCRNAAENRYCPYCGDHPDIDKWSDQKEHHPSCEWLQIKGLWRPPIMMPLRSKANPIEADKRESEAVTPENMERFAKMILDREPLPEGKLTELIVHTLRVWAANIREALEGMNNG